MVWPSNSVSKRYVFSETILGSIKLNIHWDQTQLLHWDYAYAYAYATPTCSLVFRPYVPTGTGRLDDAWFTHLF